MRKGVPYSGGCLFVADKGKDQGRSLEHNRAEHVEGADTGRTDGARATLTRWTEEVAAGRIEAILQLYAPDAILVPTLSNEIIVTEAGRRRYFEFFLSDGNPSCTVESEESRTARNLGTITIGGIYSFRFPRATGEDIVPARFLFTFEELDAHWLITGHHSSRCV